MVKTSFHATFQIHMWCSQNILFNTDGQDLKILLLQPAVLGLA